MRSFPAAEKGRQDVSVLPGAFARYAKKQYLRHTPAFRLLSFRKPPIIKYTFK